MKVQSLLFAAAVFVGGTVEGSPFSLNARQTTTQTACVPFFNQVANRYPVDTLRTQYPDVWNMFLVGLWRMQGVTESHPWSYYQLSGIHGRPYIDWGTPASPTVNSDDGYCTHNSALFATWHRPYLLLFEYRIVKNAQNEAIKFRVDSTRWNNAANRVRLPYWDWATAGSAIPSVVMQPTVTVTIPNAAGSPVATTIPNPLYSYRFTNAQYRQQYFSGWHAGIDSTRRNPDPNTGASRDNLANQGMMNTYESRRQNTYNLFSIPTFRSFSSTADNSDNTPNAFTSAESIHNEVHSIVGGNLGHMTYVSYSSFDPIFWLHHCNIDRLTAMYQAINQASRIDPQPGTGTRSLAAGEENQNTPLYPFYYCVNGQRPYTSADWISYRSTWTAGYAYVEVPYSYRDRPAADLAAYTRGRVNALYGPTTTSTNTFGTASIAAAADEGGFVRQEWICTMSFRADMPGTYDVLVFFGDVPSDVGSWKRAENLIGGCASFGDNDGEVMRHTVKGSVPLTKDLMNRGIALDAETVVTYLKENLHWRIQRDGKEVDVTELPSLQVQVSSANVTYPADQTQLPIWGEAATHYEITADKEGGSRNKGESRFLDSQPAPPVNGTESSS